MLGLTERKIEELERTRSAHSRLDAEHLSWLRTRMGVERSLMAALQTAVAMIGLGFTLVRFLERLRQDGSADHLVISWNAPRIVGLALIAVGVVSLMIFTWQYHRARTYLRSGPYREISAVLGRQERGAMYVMSGMVVLIGLFAFASLLVRL